ncbi:hypothetical protein [Spirulina sp. CS-785/01]|uniref:hypothetical protein n=1 Tax=Spirulina sp. CS-785/01 TaxID=3021716 RepID=UPI00232F1F30|nr:hypothetical protein [Spirulina sp. CS-785/01]
MKKQSNNIGQRLLSERLLLAIVMTLLLHIFLQTDYRYSYSGDQSEISSQSQDTIWAENIAKAAR